RFAQPRMRSQSEVVVRGEVDYLPPADARFGRALRLENTQRLPCTGLPPGGKLLSEVVDRGAHRKLFCRAGRNSSPGFQLGIVLMFATSVASVNPNLAISSRPAKSQSSLYSSEGW